MVKTTHYEPTEAEIIGGKITQLLKSQSFEESRVALERGILALQRPADDNLKLYQFGDIPVELVSRLGLIEPEDRAHAEAKGFYRVGDFDGWTQARLMELPGVGLIRAERWLDALEALKIRWQDARRPGKRKSRKRT